MTQRCESTENGATRVPVYPAVVAPDEEVERLFAQAAVRGVSVRLPCHAELLAQLRLLVTCWLVARVRRDRRHAPLRRLEHEAQSLLRPRLLRPRPTDVLSTANVGGRAPSTKSMALRPWLFVTLPPPRHLGCKTKRRAERPVGPVCCARFVLCLHEPSQLIVWRAKTPLFVVSTLVLQIRFVGSFIHPRTSKAHNCAPPPNPTNKHSP